MIRLQSSKNLLSHYKFKIVTSVEWHDEVSDHATVGATRILSARFFPEH